MKKWQRVWPIANQLCAKRRRISMSVVWSGWDLLGREAAFCPYAYFEHVQNKRSRVVANNKHGKVEVGTALSHKPCGSIVVRLQHRRQLF